MLPIIEILLLAGICHNTSEAAAIAAQPEFVKEANWLAAQIYPQMRIETAPKRSAWVLGLFIVGGIGCVISPTIPVGLGLISFVIFGLNKQETQRRAFKEAVRIIGERRMKDEVIREAMYQAAQQRLQIQ
jgi:hypothetical protein